MSLASRGLSAAPEPKTTMVVPLVSAGPGETPGVRCPWDRAGVLPERGVRGGRGDAGGVVGAQVFWGVAEESFWAAFLAFVTFLFSTAAAFLASAAALTARLSAAALRILSCLVSLAGFAREGCSVSCSSVTAVSECTAAALVSCSVTASTTAATSGAGSVTSVTGSAATASATGSAETGAETGSTPVWWTSTGCADASASLQGVPSSTFNRTGATSAPGSSSCGSSAGGIASSSAGGMNASSSAGGMTASSSCRFCNICIFDCNCARSLARSCFFSSRLDITYTPLAPLRWHTKDVKKVQK
eukprot:Hpha_TRINITY_DN16801_c3_g3::TRINITY_DN16801_c3_g3_i1::g.149540::m.149540